MNPVFTRLLALVFLAGPFFLQAQVAINTDGSDPDVSAMLDVVATDKGVLIPRMTKTQRDVIGSPATGLLIFQTDDDPKGFYYYNGTSWVYLGGAFITTGNVTSNSPGALATDDFVFGSDQLANKAGTDDDNRFFFDKSKGGVQSG